MTYTKDTTGDGFLGVYSGAHYKLTHKKSPNFTAILAGVVCVVFGLFALGIVLNVNVAQKALDTLIAGKK